MIVTNVYGNIDIKIQSDPNNAGFFSSFLRKTAFLVNKLGNSISYCPHKVFKHLTAYSITPNQRFFQSVKKGDINKFFKFDDKTVENAKQPIKTRNRFALCLATITLILPLMDAIGCVFKYIAAFNDSVQRHQGKIKQISDCQQKIENLEKINVIASQFHQIMKIYNDYPTEEFNELNECKFRVSINSTYIQIMGDLFEELRPFATIKRFNCSTMYVDDKQPKDEQIRYWKEEGNLYNVFATNVFYMMCHLSMGNPYDFYKYRCDGLSERQRLRHFMLDHMEDLLNLVNEDTRRLQQEISNLH